MMGLLHPGGSDQSYWPVNIYADGILGVWRNSYGDDLLISIIYMAICGIVVPVKNDTVIGSC